MDIVEIFQLLCETPKSPPGDYNPIRSPSKITRRISVCETPKSPPGDYNTLLMLLSILMRMLSSVKHLNPRQGITMGQR